jgi:hypothetical protein
MHFRLRYIIRGFEFGNARINVSDPARQIEIVISKRPADETHPTLEPNQGVAAAVCQREIPPRHHAEAASSGSLSRRREAVGQVHLDLQEFILRTLRLVRWRTNSLKAEPNPIQWAIEFSWSLDGEEWKPVADNLTGKLILSRLPDWTTQTAEFVSTEGVGQLDEPLGHELLRDAAVNRKENLRSSLVMAVVAAEVGFKQFTSRVFPDTDWILEQLPSPPLTKMLEIFPWPKLSVRINGKVPSIPPSILNELKKAVKLRNTVVHTGVVNVKAETVDLILTSVRDLLYFLDALRGQNWATTYMSPDALRHFD